MDLCEKDPLISHPFHVHSAALRAVGPDKVHDSLSTDLSPAPLAPPTPPAPLAPPTPPAPLGTFMTSIGALTATTMGAGILSLPISLVYAGLIPGTLLLVLFALCSDYSLMILVRARRWTKAASLEDLAYILYGQPGFVTVNALLLVLLFGFMVAIPIIITDSLLPFWELLPVEGFLAFILGYVSPRHSISFLAIFAMFPLLLTTRIGALKYSSWLAVFSVIYLILLMLYTFIIGPNDFQSIQYFPHFGPSQSLSQSVGLITIPLSSTLFPLAFPIQSVAFCSHFNIIPIDVDLQLPYRSRINAIIHWSTLCFTLVGYCLFAIVAYLHFGAGKIAPDVLTNLQQTHSGLVARLALTVTMMCKFPLVVLPFREVVNNLVFGRQFQGATLSLETAAICIAVLASTWYVKDLGFAFSLVGSVAGIAVCFVLPPLMYMKAAQLYQTDEQGLRIRMWREKGLCGFMITMAGVSAMAGLVTTFTLR